MLDIRALSPDDWRTIRSVRLRSLEESPGAFTSTHGREAAFDEATWRQRATTCQWFVAFDDGAPVGVAGGLDGRSDDPMDRELVAMWVAPSHRGRGIARLLLESVGAWAGSEGAVTLRLGLRQGNREARAAYLRLGLRPTGETMAALGIPDEVVEMLQLELPGVG
jgi:GNAT superfamily N-acetyltransferase